jgi:hypothetical protein
MGKETSIVPVDGREICEEVRLVGFDRNVQSIVYIVDSSNTDISNFTANRKMKGQALSISLDNYPKIDTPHWSGGAEELIRRKVEENLKVDRRTNFEIMHMPTSEGYREVGGYIVRKDNGELRESKFSKDGEHIYEVVNGRKRIKAFNLKNLDVSFKELALEKNDSLVLFHTHPVTSGMEFFSDYDIKSGANVFEELKGYSKEASTSVDFYNVLYIPKSDKFFWTTYRDFLMPKAIRNAIYKGKPLPPLGSLQKC